MEKGEGYCSVTGGTADLCVKANTFIHAYYVIMRTPNAMFSQWWVQKCTTRYTYTTRTENDLWCVYGDEQDPDGSVGVHIGNTNFRIRLVRDRTTSTTNAPTTISVFSPFLVGRRKTLDFRWFRSSSNEMRTTFSSQYRSAILSPPDGKSAVYLYNVVIPNVGVSHKEGGLPSFKFS